MSRIRHRKRSTRAGRIPAESGAGSPPGGPSSPGNDRPPPRIWLSVLGVALLLLSGALAFHWFGLEHGTTDASSALSAPAHTAGYVGASACARCHQPEYERWQQSHHALAMLQPGTESVLGDFRDSHYEKDGRRSSFFRSGSQFVVKTEGPDGRTADYPVRFTFGWKPLQQYLLQLPGGHLQAFSVAWDTRGASEGGQRWFHLYPDDNIDFRDPLHWSGPYQNWNFMCSDCHSTNVRHNYDATTDRFDTQWSELNVACEACHGPGSDHLDWADGQDHFWTRWRNADESRGLVVRFGDSARPDRRAAILQRSTLSFVESAELRTCAVCHSRRTPLTNEFLPAEGFDQHYLAALLSDDLYFVDGQIKDEVYEYNSFRQSKMFAKGVNCSDCHDPHSAQLRSDRQGVCLQCHAADRYDAASHHHHPETDRVRTVECVDCHMPQRNYMVVDPRRDHSFRVPRPDLTERFGVPNACRQCHGDKPADWAAMQVKQWLGRDASGFQQFAETLHAVRRTTIGAETRLRTMLDSATTPPVAKASVLADAGPLLHAIPDALQRSLRSPFVTERLGALRATESLPLESRWSIAEHLLADSERAIRIEAARLLARSDLDADQRRRLSGPLHELQSAATVYASRPQWRMIAGSLAAALGQPLQAVAEYEAALRIQPGFSQAYANLADVYRGLGQEDKVREVLARGLAAAPDEAALHYAQGLHLVRVGRLPDGLKAIKRAIDLAPDDSTFAYGYAVGLYSAGDKKPAFDFLKRRLSRFPTDRSALYLLTQIAIQERRFTALGPYRGTLEQLATDDPVARQLLEAMPPQGSDPPAASKP